MNVSLTERVRVEGRRSTLLEMLEPQRHTVHSWLYSSVTESVGVEPVNIYLKTDYNVEKTLRVICNH